MILIIDERAEVVEAFASLFDREGIAVSGINPLDLQKWISDVPDAELEALDAILIGSAQERASLSKVVRARTHTAVIAVNDNRSLEETLDLFAAGVDDVVRKPVHVREIMARVGAIRRRGLELGRETPVSALRVYFDGRDPEVGGEVMRLPRRERRILEFLVSKRGRRVTKAQIFSAVYGLFNDAIDETIIESHISKLRKRLRHRLGYDPVDSQRFLGYRLVLADAAISYPEGQMALPAA